MSSPKQALIRGAMWTVATRWAIKGVGFLNTVVMARLLVPADYGVVAMATLMVALIRAFMDMGAVTALLRKHEVTIDEANAAWTLRLMQSLLGAALLAVTSSWASRYFGEPRVEVILWFLCVALILEGASNIGLVLAQKQFNFALDFKVNLLAKLCGVVTTWAVGWWLGDYRALVAGIFVGSLLVFLLSYLLHPHRPVWTTRGIAQIWKHSKWLLLSNVGGFLLGRSDELIAARIGSPAQYGAYHVGGDLGRLAVSEVGPAMVRAFLPVLATIKHDVARTNAAVLKTIAATNAITLPLGLGVAAVAVPLTEIVLGAKWSLAAPFVALYSVVAVIRFSVSALNAELILYGHTRTQSTLMWAELVFFVIGVLLFMPDHHLLGLIWARVLASALACILAVWYARQRCAQRFTGVLAALWRPVCGALLMYGLVAWLMTLEGFSSGLRLAGGVFAGALFYSAWLILSWFAAGRPEGLESTLLDYLQRNTSGMHPR
jgi:O-antigen/teichoic acid export membrane protein